MTFAIELKLEDLAASTKSAMATGPFGSAVSSKNFRSEGVPMLRGSNLSEDVGKKLVEADLVYLDPELAQSFKRSIAREGDLIFTCWGSVGQIGLVQGSSRYSEYVVSNKQMKFTPDATKVEPTFLYYYLSQPHMIDLVKGQAIGSTIPGFNLGQLRQLPIALPPLPEQQAIAEVLGALDDKIAANTKLSGLADELIRAEFLRIGSAGNVPLSELATTRREQADPKTVEVHLPYVGLEHIPRRSMWMDNHGYASEVTSGKSRFQSGDILFGKLRPYFHKVIGASTDGICSTDVIVVTARQPALQGAVLAAVSSDAVVEAATAMSEGTRMPRTSWKDLASVEVPWPTDSDALNFSDRVIGIQNAVESQLCENRTLAATRDALLPQLMSGKLRVRDAEHLASEVL